MILRPAYPILQLFRSALIVTIPPFLNIYGLSTASATLHVMITTTDLSCTILMDIDPFQLFLESASRCLYGPFNTKIIWIVAPLLIIYFLLSQLSLPFLFCSVLSFSFSFLYSTSLRFLLLSFL